MPVAYIYIYVHAGKLLFNKAKKNKPKKNYIKIAMPVAKHTAQYA